MSFHTFTKRFEYEGTYIDIGINTWLNKDNTCSINSLIFTSETFQRTINIDNSMIDGFLYGGNLNDYSHYGPSNNRFEFVWSWGCNGDYFIDFKFSIPMEVAIDIHNYIKRITGK